MKCIVLIAAVLAVAASIIYASLRPRGFATPAECLDTRWLAKVQWAGGQIVSGGVVMAITVEAVYENGMLKLSEPLPLAPQEKVRVTVHTAAEPDRVQRAYGLLGWTGDSETVQRVALDPEYGLPEEP